MTQAQDSFAFIIHPIDPKRDIGRKYPALGKLPAWLIEFLCLFAPPVYISEISGVQSLANGRRLKGWFVACTLTPARMLSLPPNIVVRKIVQTAHLAERLGAKIVGLGAYTSVVGDGGITIAREVDVPVTTGDSYTVATAVEAVRQAAAIMEIPLPDVTLAIVGATGAIGAVCAEAMATETKRMVLIGRRMDRLNEVAQKVQASGGSDVMVTDDMNHLAEAHLIITVTSAVDSIIEPQHLRRGAVVCDVARPRDVSRLVAEERPDVLVIEGGLVAVPGAVDFGFDFGFPPGMAFACMAETMALALEQRYESYTLGKDITLSQVRTIDKIATKHGFKLGGFRSFERAVTQEEIAAIKAYSRSSKLTGNTKRRIVRDQPEVGRPVLVNRQGKSS